MSLPAREQRVLERIDDGLCTSEPRLAAKFAMFARLCGGEVPPWREQLTRRPAARSWARALVGWAAARRWRTSNRGSAVRRAVVVANLAIALVLLAVLVAVNAHSGGRCGSGGAGRGAAAARVRDCPLQVGTQDNLLPK